MHIMAQKVTTEDPADVFNDEIKMWVYEEDHEVRRSCVADTYLACCMTCS